MQYLRVLGDVAGYSKRTAGMETGRLVNGSLKNSFNLMQNSLMAHQPPVPKTKEVATQVV